MMERGRPTKYDPAYCDDIERYFLDAEPFSTDVEPTGKRVLMPNKLPTIERWALNKRINPDTVYEWAKKHPEFSESLTRAVRAQKDLLVQGGLFGSYEKTIVKLLLGANHGVVEKVETKNEHSGQMTVSWPLPQSKLDD
jgi:hypothetical protein